MLCTCDDANIGIDHRDKEACSCRVTNNITTYSIMSTSSKASSSSAAAVSTPTKNTSQTTNSKQHQSSNTAAGEYMLEHLRILLNRLQSTTEILQTWPTETQGDNSAKVHAESCTELISSIRNIVLGLRSVECHVNGTGPSNNNNTNNTTGKTEDASNKETATPGEGGSQIQLSQISNESLQSFRSSLDTKCPIPLDLLDLLDVGIQQSKGSSNTFGINPQVYVRTLMKESKRQLCGLERRKRSLSMLATCIEVGMKKDKVSSLGGVLDDNVDKKDVEKKKSNVKRKRDGDDLSQEGETKKIRAN